MKLPRRQFLHLAAGAAALPAVSRIARAQAYPTDRLVGFAYLILLRYFAELSNSRVRFDSLRSGLFSSQCRCRRTMSMNTS
jgi:hypothetical protein